MCDETAEANMRKWRARQPVSSIGSVLFAALAFTATASVRAADSYSIELTGDQVGPSPADPDGEGMATISVRSGEGRICYTLSVEGIKPPFAAHLHAAVAGRIGPIRLQLDPPVDGYSQRCIRADRDLLRALEQRPQSFYIDIHTSEYPGAALRGQLGT